jgi:hypothetical protein
MRSRFVPALALAALLAACGGAQERGPIADPRELLGRGEYVAARLAALARGGDAPADRAVIALSLIAEHPDREAAARAVDALAKGGARDAAVRAAIEMLAIYPTAPDCADAERALLAAEIGLGAAGLGPLAAGSAASASGGAGDFDLGTAILERLRLGLAGAGAIETARLLAIWNGCFSLLGGSMRGPTDAQGWALYENLGGLAALVGKAAPDTALARALLASAVAAVEANPALTTAVRCDLGSPFDDLRTALTYDRDLLGRLERAVAQALGCTRGRYAPRPPQ